MKKSHLYILIAVIALALVVAGIVLYAVIPPKVTSEGLVFELSADKKSYVVTDMDNRWARAVAVPAEYNGKPVSIIGAYAFQNCRRLESIDLPDSIEKVHSGAFKDCVRLREIVLPEKVDTVGARAFYGCRALQSVTVPAGAELQIGAFEGCTNIKNATISADALAAIPSEKLESVVLNGGKHIHERSFMGYTALREITICASIEEIGHLAFNGCEKLERVNIEDLAAWCRIDFAESDANPLRYAKNLYLNGELITKLVIPEGVTEIKARAFDGATGIKLIELPASLSKIGDHAFRGTGIAAITVGEGVTEMGKYVFYNCASLKNIYVDLEEMPNTWSATWSEGVRATIHWKASDAL